MASGEVPSVMGVYLDWTKTALTWIFWPVGIAVYYLGVAVFTVLKLLYLSVAFVLQPVVYFGQLVLACIALPFRLLAKLEPLYNYFGIAVLVGLLFGLGLAFVCATLYGLFGIDARLQPEVEPPRTAKQYREDKAKLRRKHEQPLLSPDYVNTSESTGLGELSSRTRSLLARSLLAQTIMEEADSDY